MWRLKVNNPCNYEDCLFELEAKSLQQLVNKYRENFDNGFITYNKLENIKLGRSNSYPFICLERF